MVIDLLPHIFKDLVNIMSNDIEWLVNISLCDRKVNKWTVFWLVVTWILNKSSRLNYFLSLSLSLPPPRPQNLYIYIRLVTLNQFKAVGNSKLFSSLDGSILAIYTSIRNRKHRKKMDWFWML